MRSGWEVRQMKKCVSFAVAATVVISSCSLLCTYGIAGMVKLPSPVMELSASPVFAHFDASPWQQRLETDPYEAGEALPFEGQKQFLLTLDNVEFACGGNDNGCDHYYRQCGLDIDYTLYAKKVRPAVNEAVISCRARIVYRTEGGCQLCSETEPETYHHAFKYHAEFSSRLSLSFHFSEYEQVTEVQLDKLECRVHPADYVSDVTGPVAD